MGGFALRIAWVSASLYLSFMSTNLGIAVNIRPAIAVRKFGEIFFTFISIGLMFGYIFSSILFVVKDKVNCEQNEVTMATEHTTTVASNNTNLSHDPLVCSCDLGSAIENET